jgi:hypothetical protein
MGDIRIERIREQVRRASSIGYVEDVNYLLGRIAKLQQEIDEREADDKNRWRERALEAERRLADLRDYIAAKQS